MEGKAAKEWAKRRIRFVERCEAEVREEPFFFFLEKREGCEAENKIWDEEGGEEPAGEAGGEVGWRVVVR